MNRPLILLLNPWIHDFAAYDLWARPMGLLVLATRLRQLGWEPRLVDCLDRDHPNQERVFHDVGEIAGVEGMAVIQGK